MLNLDQVRLLENRVEKAVAKIQAITAENTLLRSQLASLQTHVGELEGLVSSFKDDQSRIEEGILSALDRLSAFEDSVFQGSESTLSKPAEVANTIPQEGKITSTVESDAQDLIDEDEPLSIEAEWKDSTLELKSDSDDTDGQMDIF